MGRGMNSSVVTGITRLNTEPSEGTYLTGFYAGLMFLGGLLALGAALFLAGRQQASIVIALILGVVMLGLAWAFRTRQPWRYRAADGFHLALLVWGAFNLIIWLKSVLDLINADARVAEAGGAPGIILARLSSLTIDPLPVADVLLLLAAGAGLVWFMRRLRYAEAERRLDQTRRTELELLLQRFTRNTSARVGGLMVIALLIIVYLMPRVDPYTREVALADGNLTLRLRAPDCVIGWMRLQQGLDTWQGEGARPTSVFEFPCNHPFGTDKNGRDLFRRVLHGISVSLAVSVISVSISLLIGASIGLAAGYLGGGVDSLLMRTMDIMLAFPALLLAIAIVAMRGPGLQNAMIAIGIVGIPAYARLARSMSIALREQEFVTAALSLGTSRFRILRQHILPNSLAPIIVQSTLGLGTAVIETAALGFLGLGQQPPFPELGKMLAESREVMISGMWWMLFFPGLTVMIIVLSFNLLGDALRDTLDPKLRGK